jgi:hypothetical protein
MRRTLKGFLGMLMVIGLMALAGGYVYAQPVPPLRAHVPDTDDYALMNLKMNLQCTEQETIEVNPTTITGTTKKYNINEKDIIELLSWHPECVASGTFPTDIKKARLYYQYTSGSGLVAKVANDTSTADITNTCMALGQASPAAFAGSENLITTTNSAKLTWLVDVRVTIDVPGTASADGLVLQFTGPAKENLNLPKLNKGKQTLTDSWNASGSGFGLARILNTSTKPVYCTGTVQANGNFKRVP